jgi:hypothetical protein
MNLLLLYTQFSISSLLLIDYVLNLLALLLLFICFNLQELIIDHLLSVLYDPLLDLAHINLFTLLPRLGRICPLLLIQLSTLLHSNQLFLLPFHIYFLLAIFSFQRIVLPLCFQNGPLVICYFFSPLLFQVCQIRALFLYFLHHCHFLGLHFVDF